MQTMNEVLKEGFGTKARNAGYTLSKNDIVVPLCSNLKQRQELANRGVYTGVEYRICSLYLLENELMTMDSVPPSEKTYVTALIQPAYPLRPHLERDDWPVSIRPLRDVPLWLSRSTYRAGTALGTAMLALGYLGVASLLAFFIRVAYVPSESMVPALYPGDVVLVSRSANVAPLRPKAGDVLFFEPPRELEEAVRNSRVAAAVKESGGVVPSLQGRKFLKRVVAVPGETVGVRQSNPYVVYGASRYVDDGDVVVRVDHVGPYARPDVFPPDSWDREASVLKRDEFFVAGDNGARSVDSRVWGPLKEKYIFGTAKWILYPFHHFGPVPPGKLD